MTPEQAQERVARGAALLDTKIPDWTSRIQIGELNMARNCLCILGQLEGSFWRAIERGHVGLRNHLQAVEYGFALECCRALEHSHFRTTFDETCPVCRPIWGLLQDFWIAAIADRVVTAQGNDEALAVPLSSTERVGLP